MSPSPPDPTQPTLDDAQRADEACTRRPRRAPVRHASPDELARVYDRTADQLHAYVCRLRTTARRLRDGEDPRCHR